VRLFYARKHIVHRPSAYWHEWGSGAAPCRVGCRSAPVGVGIRHFLLPVPPWRERRSRREVWCRASASAHRAFRAANNGQKGPRSCPAVYGQRSQECILQGLIVGREAPVSSSGT